MSTRLNAESQPSHPEDNYRILRLQAALPSPNQRTDPQEIAVQQDIELCFHSDFAPNQQQPLSLHFDNCSTVLSRPKQFQDKPPPNGLLVVCGKVSLVDEDELDQTETLHQVRRRHGWKEIVEAVVLGLIWVSLLIYSSIPQQRQVRPFPPLDQLLNLTLTLPLIVLNLYFNIDNLHPKDPSIPQLYIHPPPMRITNDNTVTLVETIIDTTIKVIGQRADDNKAIICNHTIKGLMQVSYKTSIFSIHANYWWWIIYHDGLDLDELYRLINNLRKGLRALTLTKFDAGTFDDNLRHPYHQYADTVGPGAAQVISLFRQTFDYIDGNFGTILLRKCDDIFHLSSNYTLLPFCQPPPLNQDKLSSWILNNDVSSEPLKWKEVPPLFQLVYYVTGLYVSASQTLDIAQQVMACHLDWKSTSTKPSYWSTWIRRKTPRRLPERWASRDPDDLPGLIANLSSLLSGPLQAEVTRVFDAATALLDVTNQLKGAKKFLDSLKTVDDWRFERAGDRFENPQEQAERLWEGLVKLENRTDILDDAHWWWIRREYFRG